MRESYRESCYAPAPPMRRELFVLVAVAAVAFGVRVYPAWDAVFGGPAVNFLETDAWYHVRLTENQVRNYPWRVTVDPYAAVGGQFVAIAPLYDTITSTAVVLWRGRNADTRDVERAAAFVPPVLGTLSIIVMWLLARRLFDWRAGLIAAALLAVLPGHFMDRTMLGFVDHHALEALLALATLLAIVWSLRPRSTALPTSSRDVAAAGSFGLTVGLYLLGWSSGAFLVGIIGVWLLLLIPVCRSDETLTRSARIVGGGALLGLAIVVLFQDSRMHRYGSQIVALLGLTGISVVILMLASRGDRGTRRPIIATGLVAVVVSTVLLWARTPELFQQLVTDLGRLTPNPARMGVLEARPLFLYPGEWNWLQPWQFFRTGFYVGAIAILFFAARVWRSRDAGDLLVWIYAIATFAATIGQNRFGYYLVTACALLGGWLATRLLDWGAAANTAFAREAATAIVAGAMFAPNLAPSILLMPRSGSLAGYWLDSMTWLRANTPPPFRQSTGLGDEYYFARYPRDVVQQPDYAIMNWWDQGYWLIQRARRVPVSNPTQERAGIAARFYAETDEVRAVEMARQQRARFVLSDWELPFRLTPERTVMGRFQSVLDWAGATHAAYYEVYYRRENDAWSPLWVFHAPYYQSMAYRLAVIGGVGAVPANATTVITVADRTDSGGRSFREVLTLDTYATFEAALQAAASRPPEAMIVGLDPWQPAFPLTGLQSFVEVHAARTADQKATEAPWVRVFEVVGGS